METPDRGVGVGGRGGMGVGGGQGRGMMGHGGGGGHGAGGGMDNVDGRGMGGGARYSGRDGGAGMGGRGDGMGGRGGGGMGEGGGGGGGGYADRGAWGGEGQGAGEFCFGFGTGAGGLVRVIWRVVLSLWWASQVDQIAVVVRSFVTGECLGFPMRALRSRVVLRARKYISAACAAFRSDVYAERSGHVQSTIRQPGALVMGPIGGQRCFGDGHICQWVVSLYYL